METRLPPTSQRSSSKSSDLVLGLLLTTRASDLPNLVDDPTLHALITACFSETQKGCFPYPPRFQDPERDDCEEDQLRKALSHQNSFKRREQRKCANTYLESLQINRQQFFQTISIYPSSPKQELLLYPDGMKFLKSFEMDALVELEAFDGFSIQMKDLKGCSQVSKGPHTFQPCVVCGSESRPRGNDPVQHYQVI